MEYDLSKLRVLSLTVEALILAEGPRCSSLRVTSEENTQ